MRVSVPVAGQGARSALVHLPKGRRSGQVPLLLALHGAYGNGAFMERYSGLSRLADRVGFGVVYPDAAGPRWRITAGEGNADVEFLDAVLDRVLSGGCFDDRRVSAVGVSNGAGMAARFACAGDDRLAGLVSVAGGYGWLPACQARRPLSVLEIHGTADRVVPYWGRSQDRRGDVRPLARPVGRSRRLRARGAAHAVAPERPAPRLVAMPRRDVGRAPAARRRGPRLAGGRSARSRAAVRRLGLR